MSGIVTITGCAPALLEEFGLVIANTFVADNSVRHNAEQQLQSLLHRDEAGVLLFEAFFCEALSERVRQSAGLQLKNKVKNWTSMPLEFLVLLRQHLPRLVCHPLASLRRAANDVISYLVAKDDTGVWKELADQLHSGMQSDVEVEILGSFDLMCSLITVAGAVLAQVDPDFTQNVFVNLTALLTSSSSLPRREWILKTLHNFVSYIGFPFCDEANDAAACNALLVRLFEVIRANNNTPEMIGQICLLFSVIMECYPEVYSDQMLNDAYTLMLSAAQHDHYKIVHESIKFWRAAASYNSRLEILSPFVGKLASVLFDNMVMTKADLEGLNDTDAEENGQSGNDADEEDDNEEDEEEESIFWGTDYTNRKLAANCLEAFSTLFPDIVGPIIVSVVERGLQIPIDAPSAEQSNLFTMQLRQEGYNQVTPMDLYSLYSMSINKCANFAADGFFLNADWSANHLHKLGLPAWAQVETALFALGVCGLVIPALTAHAGSMLPILRTACTLNINCMESIAVWTAARLVIPHCKTALNGDATAREIVTAYLDFFVKGLENEKKTSMLRVKLSRLQEVMDQAQMLTFAALGPVAQILTHLLRTTKDRVVLSSVIDCSSSLVVAVRANITQQQAGPFVQTIFESFVKLPDTTSAFRSGCYIMGVLFGTLPAAIAAPMIDPTLQKALVCLQRCVPLLQHADEQDEVEAEDVHFDNVVGACNLVECIINAKGAPVSQMLSQTTIPFFLMHAATSQRAPLARSAMYAIVKGAKAYWEGWSEICQNVAVYKLKSSREITEAAYWIATFCLQRGINVVSDFKSLCTQISGAFSNRNPNKEVDRVAGSFCFVFAAMMHMNHSLTGIMCSSLLAPSLTYILGFTEDPIKLNAIVAAFTLVLQFPEAAVPCCKPLYTLIHNMKPGELAELPLQLQNLIQQFLDTYPPN